MKTKHLTLMALFAALVAILAQLSIPIGPVPVNFAHIGIFLSAALLGPKLGTVSILIYILIGIIGMPVFSNFNGGLGAIAGPTGGFILGYLICALITGYLIKTTRRFMLSMSLGLLANYLVGIPWLMFVTGMNFQNAFLIAVLPFILGDCLKVLLSTLIAKRLQHFFNY